MHKHKHNRNVRRVRANPRSLYEDNNPVAQVQYPKIDVDQKRVIFFAANSANLLQTDKLLRVPELTSPTRPWHDRISGPRFSDHAPASRSDVVSLRSGLCWSEEMMIYDSLGACSPCLPHGLCRSAGSCAAIRMGMAKICPARSVSFRASPGGRILRPPSGSLKSGKGSLARSRSALWGEN